MASPAAPGPAQDAQRQGTPWWRSLPGGRLAIRLFAMFVVAAMLPVALSDWLALTAVTRIAENLHEKAHADRTRELSRQVLDRLLAARDQLAALPSPREGQMQPSVDALPGVGTTFVRLEPMPPTAHRPAQTGGPERYGLWVDAQGSGTPRILLDRHIAGAPGWRAELRLQALWSPLTEGAGDTRWRVLDARGRELLNHVPLDDIGPDLRLASVALPLDGLFEAGSWQFEHQTPRPVIRFMGWPLATWLVLLALATGCAVALAAHWRIRRVFQPLEALTASTRRLAEGDSSARVDVSASPARDELDQLAVSFNDMATRIDDQLGALRELSAIDHDILGGAPLEQVARRLLTQLLRAAPGAASSISWRDTARTDGDHGPGGMRTLRGPLPAGVPSDGTARGWTQVRRKVERAGRLEGLIELALPPGAREPDRLDALRDRLAVALAARRRDHELAWRATHDSLTGLQNRLGLHERLDQELADPSPGAEPPRLALVMIDLDHFKDINDTRGHDVGDLLLCQVADRLRAAVPAGATVARLGGDEFVVCLPGLHTAQAVALAQTLCARLKAPFTIDGIEALVGASSGIAVAPDHGLTRLDLARKADIALYTAKLQRGSVCLFQDALDQAARERAAWVAELRAAIERREFLLHFQPRVAAADASLVSVEALARWQHPRHGLLHPARFIDIAEQAGLMDGLGALVLDEACRQMAAWRAAAVPVPKVSVNVSMQQLATGHLPGLVRHTLARHGLPAHTLELEVTESLLAADAAGAQQQLHELRALGVEIALDDFGTGYSAMSQLRQLPIDVMKIDRAFVTDLDTDDGALAIARAIVALAGALGLRIVAEGVETEQQAARLRELGCHELQGYLIARPMPADAMVPFLDAAATPRVALQAAALHA